MSNPAAFDRPDKTSAMLVRFTWGAANERLYTDWTHMQEVLGRRYESAPTMEIEWPANTGGLRDQPFVVTLPIDAFTTRLSDVYPHAQVRMEVREFVVGEQDAYADVVWSGKVKRCRRSSEGLSGSVRIEGVGIKSDLEVPLGMPSTPECIWTFGGVGCASPRKASLTITGSRVTSLDRNVMTVDAILPSTPWVRGYVERDGLTVTIRDYDMLLAPNTLQLAKAPPPEWFGALVTLVPGCRKTIDACRTDHSNEEHFMGCGVKIPAYHPIIESS
ncbi:MAG: phage BR0599 family protein [Dehalococcoidia bacterium]